MPARWGRGTVGAWPCLPLPELWYLGPWHKNRAREQVYERRALRVRDKASQSAERKEALCQTPETLSPRWSTGLRRPLLFDGRGLCQGLISEEEENGVP